jgi:hypothetical protein
VRREKIAKITPESGEAADAVGLNSQSAHLAIADRMERPCALRSDKIPRIKSGWTCVPRILARLISSESAALKTSAHWG